MRRMSKRAMRMECWPVSDTLIIYYSPLTVCTAFINDEEEEEKDDEDEDGNDAGANDGEDEGKH